MFPVTVLTKFQFFFFFKIEIKHCGQWENAKHPLSWKWAAVAQNGVKFGTRVSSKYSKYTYNFWHFGQWPSFMPKYGNFENRPVSRKPLPVE